MGMIHSVRDVIPEVFIQKYASHLKKQGKVKVPHLCEYAKSASFKELAPYDDDWWFTRVAAVARRIYLKEGLGVRYFRNVYGGSQRRGAKPNGHALSSGNIIRKCLHQLELTGIIEKIAKGGRKITDTGRHDLDFIARRCS